MKKLLLGVMLVGMVFAVSSCMSDETFADITKTYVAKGMQWALASAFDPEARARIDAMSEAERDKIYEELLVEACKEHGYTVAAYKRKAKALGKKLDLSEFEELEFNP